MLVIMRLLTSWRRTNNIYEEVLLFQRQCNCPYPNVQIIARLYKTIYLCYFRFLHVSRIVSVFMYYQYKVNTVIIKMCLDCPLTHLPTFFSWNSPYYTVHIVQDASVCSNIVLMENDFFLLQADVLPIVL